MDEEISHTFSNDHKLYRLSDYLILSKLGCGTYGKVYLAKNKQDKFLYAIKKSDISEEDGVCRQTLREISLLKVLQHPNIITLYQIFFTNEKCYMVIEYLKVSLATFIKEYDMNHNLIKSFMFQLFQAVLFCHNRGVIHRDIKPHNILVHHNMQVVKLIDFGMAKKVDNTNLPLTPIVVTLFYRSPELLMKIADYTSSIDIWSLGCVFVEMIMKRVPFRGIGDTTELDVLYSCFAQLGLPTKDDLPSELLDKIEINEDEDTVNVIEMLKETVDDRCYNLIMKMFTYNPYTRIDAAEALFDEYFKDFDTSIVPAIDEQFCGRPTTNGPN